MKNDPIQSAGEAAPTDFFTAEAYSRWAARLDVALKLDQATQVVECIEELKALRPHLQAAAQESCDALLSSNPVVGALRRAATNHEHCQMWNALKEFVAAGTRFDALPDLQSDEETVFYQAMIEPLWDRLKFDTPICTSRDGAALAMQIGGQNLKESIGGYGLALLAEAMRYYQRAEL
jgi:hypothetical protein